jgi:hypothetical protein
MAMLLKNGKVKLCGSCCETRGFEDVKLTTAGSSYRGQFFRFLPFQESGSGIR